VNAIGQREHTAAVRRSHVRHGRLLSRSRILAGLSQRELGELTGIPLSMIQAYEQGRCLPGAHRTVALLHTLNIPPAQWIGA